jgi:hypothetical protein
MPASGSVPSSSTTSRVRHAADTASPAIFIARCGVLPAFGAFTGTAVVRPRQGDQVFVIADGEVLRV